MKVLAKSASFELLRSRSEQSGGAEKWASGYISHPEPLWFERNAQPRGQLLKSQPAKTRDCMRFVFGGSGGVVRIRIWSGARKNWSEEEFFSEKKSNVVVRHRFQSDGTLISIHRYTFKNDRLALHEAFLADKGLETAETFTWKDGLLVRTSVKNGATQVITWDDDGEVASIRDEKSKKLIYSRPKDDGTIADFLPIVSERMLDLVPRVVAKYLPKSPLLGLALVVDDNDFEHALPPTLGLVFEDELMAVKGTHQGYLQLWNPSELKHLGGAKLQLKDKALSAAAKRANELLCGKSEQEKFIPFLRKVATELGQVQWQRALSDNFFVYVTTRDGSGYDDAWRDASPLIRKRLAGRGGFAPQVGRFNR